MSLVASSRKRAMVPALTIRGASAADGRKTELTIRIFDDTIEVVAATIVGFIIEAGG